MPGEDARSCECSPGFKGRHCELGKFGAAPLACWGSLWLGPGPDTLVTAGSDGTAGPRGGLPQGPPAMRCRDRGLATVPQTSKRPGREAGRQ